jgi:TonB-dependent starch-binding outer membrane protein SusC
MNSILFNPIYYMMNNYKTRLMPITLRIALFIVLLLSSTVIWAQSTNYTITGRIVEENSSTPVIGATVQVENLSFGTITDMDGNFKFKVSLESGEYIVTVRSVGYATLKENISLGNNTEVNLELSMQSDILSLNEVIVTGTGGLTEKKKLGNSIATLDGAEIAGSGAVDVTGSLSGKMAGIQVMQNSGDPAGGVSVRLRSASTVNGSSDPLYIIDGVIVNNNSTDVLSSVSQVQNRLSDINPQDIDRIEVIKGGAAAAIYGSRASNGVVQIFTKKGSTGAPKITFSTSVNFNSLRKKRDFNDVPLTWVNSAPDTQTEAATRYDYQDMIFNKSMGTDNYVSIAGGKDNTKYFGSVSHMFNEGIQKGTDFTRTSGRIRIDQKINDRASLSFGSYIARSHSNDKPNGGYTGGVLTSYIFANNVTDPAPDADGNYPSPDFREYIDLYDFQQLNNRSISDFQLNLAPIKGLTVNYILGYDNAQSIGIKYVPIGTTSAPGGLAATSSINTLQLNSDINAVYETKISDNLTSTTATGYTYQYDNSNTTTINASQLALGVKTTWGAANVNTFEFRTERSIWGAYVQQTFGYKDKLFLTGAVRIDGASVFGKDERNQFYPKASVAYVISDEDFWKSSMPAVLNSFKVRAAWGQAGNLTAIDAFDRLTNYNPVAINDKSGAISPSRIGTPDLRPEQQTEIEFGFDMALLNNRVGLEFTYYTQNISDLLLERSLSPSTGFTTKIENVGTMTNVGYEIMITATPVQTADFKWNLTATFSANKNEVNGIEGDELAVGNFGFSKAKNGEALGVFRQGYYARNPDGSLLLTPAGLPQRERGYVDEFGNNVHERDSITDQPTGSTLQKVIGDPNPDFIASLINEFTYKAWSFRLQFDAVQGFDILSWDTRMFYRFGGGVQEAAELNGEETRGTGAAKFGIAEAYIEDGSFIKLREMSISYLLMKPFKGINDVRFTLSGRNLFSIDKFSSWDPEVNMDAQSNGGRGGVMAIIPIPKTIKFALIASF